MVLYVRSFWATVKHFHALSQMENLCFDHFEPFGFEPPPFALTFVAKIKVIAFGCGADFRVSHSKLVPSHEIDGLVMGDQRADVTQGLAFAENNGIIDVDSAGQQATSGAVTELCGVTWIKTSEEPDFSSSSVGALTRNKPRLIGISQVQLSWHFKHGRKALMWLVFVNQGCSPPNSQILAPEAINRCAVQQKARSVRVALVLKDARLDVGVARGGSAIRDSFFIKVFPMHLVCWSVPCVEKVEIFLWRVLWLRRLRTCGQSLSRHPGASCIHWFDLDQPPAESLASRSCKVCVDGDPGCPGRSGDFSRGTRPQWLRPIFFSGPMKQREMAQICWNETEMRSCPQSWHFQRVLELAWKTTGVGVASCSLSGLLEASMAGSSSRDIRSHQKGWYSFDTCGSNAKLPVPRLFGGLGTRV